jgi:succinate dehydrogenase/fumarate reductase-like Fe-S protein
MTDPLSLTVNGKQREVELNDPRVTLLDLLREHLHLTGTKKGCDRGQCGACTVLVDGRRINSCLTLALSCDGAEGLVKFIDTPKHRRSMLVQLTPKGEKRLPRAERPFPGGRIDTGRRSQQRRYPQGDEDRAATK